MLHQQDDRSGLAHFADDGENLGYDHRRQAFRGLVDQDDTRFGHHDTSHRQHLLLAARQGVSGLFAALRKAGKPVINRV